MIQHFMEKSRLSACSFQFHELPKTSTLSRLQTFLCSRWLLEYITSKGEIPHDEQFLLLTQYFQLHSIIILPYFCLQLRTSWNWQIYRSCSAPFSSVPLRSRSNLLSKRSLIHNIVIAFFRSVQIERFFTLTRNAFFSIKIRSTIWLA